MKKLPIVLLAALVLPALARADEAPSLELSAAVGEAAPAVAPLRSVESMALPESNTLEEAWIGAADKVAAMKAWNAAHRRPTQNGFTRVLKTPLRAELGASAFAPSSSGRFVAETVADSSVWSTRLRVKSANRLRVHLENISAPVGTVFTVWSATTRPRSFGFELRGPGGDIWTPSVSGEDVYLEARAPGGGDQIKGGFEIREVVELLALEPFGSSCIIDATCTSSSTFSGIADARKAIAQLEFIDAGDAYVCTGGLLNDTDNGSTIPYLLTANHCISTQAVASTLDATWDFKTSSCNGPPPNINSLPSSSGATLLATSVQSDFCLLRLNSIPGGRVLLGWNSGSLSNGAKLSRVSHPLPDSDVLPQSFSQTNFTSNPDGVCDTDEDGRPWGNLTKFRYSIPLNGGIAGGSSGSPVMNSGGQVVGQLLGTCGSDPDNGCSEDNYIVDGAFSATYPSVAQFLSPTTNPGPCVRSATTACLQSSRFEVKITFNGDSASGNANVMSFGGQRAENNESAFYFFNSATNFEMGVKVLNACVPALGNKFWVFVSGLTDQGWHVTVRDAQTGVTKNYSNANHHLTSTTADTAAFSCP